MTTLLTCMLLAATCRPVLAQATVSAQLPDSQAATPRPRPEESSDYRVGPGDLLVIQVFGVSEFGQGVRVSNSGKVNLSHLGIVNVAGKTVAQLESELGVKLRDKGLVRDPWVLVKVAEYRAYPVYILGEVMTPGQFVLKRAMMLRDLVVLGQGFNSKASPIGFLYRMKPHEAKTPDDGTGSNAAAAPGESAATEVIKVDFRELESNPELNVQLRAGDVLYCPERRKAHYFVVGEVMVPGRYEMEEPLYDQESNVGGSTMLRLTQALAKAGGPAKTAKLSKALLVRYGPNLDRQEIALDFDAVLKGKQPDIEVRLNDIIFIPGSTAKTLAYGLLGTLPAIVTTQVSGAVQ